MSNGKYKLFRTKIGYTKVRVQKSWCNGGEQQRDVENEVFPEKILVV